MDAIVTDNLTKRFGELAAVDGLSLTVHAGEIFCLVGPDGAGKTTTMRLLTGVMSPTSGAARVADYDVVRQAEPLKAHIGYMSQRFGLYEDLSVIENIEFYAEIYEVPRHELAARIDRLLDFSNLRPFRKRLAGKLSGGMKQKLGLACALVHTPRVLFLDEPTNGVDPVSRRDFWRILYQLLREGVTIFVSTAYLDEAERCHRLALIHNGRLLAVGAPDEVKKQMRGAIIELRCAQGRQAVGLLREQLAGASVGLFGDKIHIATNRPDETSAAAQEIVEQAGLEVQACTAIEPSLEDVFISMVTRKDNDEPQRHKEYQEKLGE